MNSNIYHVLDVYSIDEVNELLKKGWRLISVCPNQAGTRFPNRTTLFVVGATKEVFENSKNTK
ncbi:TPA: hypothetical protein I0F94_RS02145 [Enterococcus faecalis]|nr:hypothetical protein [Enterococcus faecalis]